MTCLVCGAGQVLGARIALDLARRGTPVLATRRTPRPALDTVLEQAGVELSRLDVTDLAGVRALAGKVDTAVLTPILSLAAPAAVALAEAGVPRGVVFSSNNVGVVGTDPVYDRLRMGEAQVLEAAPGWAILRPTMIYGHAGDGNLSRLVRWLRRLPVHPLLGSGRSLQQPIHVDDLARLAAGLVSGAWPATGTLAVGGPDRLSHRALVASVARAAGVRRPVLPVPIAPVRAGVGLAARLGLTLPVTPAQLARLELDKPAVDAADPPADLAPRVGLDAGLARLVAEIDATPPGSDTRPPTGAGPGSRR